MINNMLKLNKKMVQNRNYYHTCPACRINIFNADFRIFLYNRAGNKTDDLCAQNVLTEARVSGLRASVLRTLGRQVRLSFLPRLAPARKPGSLSPRCSLPGREVAAGLAHKVQKATSLLTARGDSSGLCLVALQPEEKLLRDSPPPRLSGSAPV